MHKLATAHDSVKDTPRTHHAQTKDILATYGSRRDMKIRQSRPWNQSNMADLWGVRWVRANPLRASNQCTKLPSITLSWQNIPLPCFIAHH